jgi:hypothetical protein
MKLLAITVSLASLLFVVPANLGRAQDGSAEGAGLLGTDANIAQQMLDLNTVELRVQLQNGLRVFLPEQQAFLDQVLIEVDNGRISRSMVNMVYVWSQRRNRKVPFPYFEYAMRVLAERRGVTL